MEPREGERLKREVREPGVQEDQDWLVDQGEDEIDEDVEDEDVDEGSVHLEDGLGSCI